MKDYIEGYHFTVLTDHQALKWLDSIDNPSGRLARWALELSQYDYDTEYRKGSKNVLADAVSRSPIDVCSVATLNEKKWYAKTYKNVIEKPEKYPDFCIKDGRLFKKFLHMLDFNEYDSDME